MKWIKASETLPDEKKSYNCRINGIPVVYYIDKGSNTVLLNDNYIPASIWDRIEWLDESTPTDPAYVEVLASEDFPEGIQNVKCVSSVSGTEMKGVGLFNSPENFTIRYLNGTTHSAGEIKLSEIIWLKPVPAPSKDKREIASEEVLLREIEFLELDRGFNDHYHLGASMMKELIKNLIASK